METTQRSLDSYPKTPFEEIALAISGGGFRAAAYGLGTMMYLNKLKFDGKTLLERVKFMSSASGGSIPVIFYALSLHRKQSFEDFKTSLLEFMKEDKLLYQALEVLKDDMAWKSEQKSRNLINSFAKVYDTAFDKATWEVIWKISYNTHLKEVCINTTEFQSGQTFRFQNREAGTTNIIGNGLVRLQSTYLDLLKQFRLADILAASSCFPVGFEPMVFPDDFAKGPQQKKALAGTINCKGPDGKTIHCEKFAIMDGGITDNQGVESMQRAFERRNKGKRNTKPFDLMIVADVSNRITIPYDTKIDGWKINSSVSFWHRLFNNVSWFFIPLALVSALSIIFDFCRIAGLLFIAPSLLLSIICLYYKHSYNKKSNQFLQWASKKSEVSPSLLSSYFSYFTKISIKTLSELLLNRVYSTATMSGEIFLKKVRNLNYNIFFENESYSFRRVSSFIYLMSISYQKQEKQGGAYKPNDKMQAVAEKARKFGTTLWFTEENKQDKMIEKIIATAQFTLCISLLNYIDSLKKEKDIYKTLEKTKELNLLRENLLKDYNFFEKDPQFLLQENSQFNQL